MKNPTINLRPATLADLPLLQHWDEQEHVIDSDPNDDWQWEKELARNPEWREQLIAELDGRAIGFIQIIDPALEESHYWGDVPQNLRAIDIWIGEEKDLGKGYGTEMMRRAIERCFDDPKVAAILIDPLFSNSRARRFYERLGFKFVERKQFGQSDCAVYELKREEWKDQQTIGNYGESYKIALKNGVQFEDGLLVSLSDFSHKRAEINSSKASAYLQVSKDGHTTEISLSETQNSKERLFSNIQWQNYLFELKEMRYGEYIVLLISKNY